MYSASSAPGHTDFSVTMIVTAWVGLLSHRCARLHRCCCHTLPLSPKTPQVRKLSAASNGRQRAAGAARRVSPLRGVVPALPAARCHQVAAPSPTRAAASASRTGGQVGFYRQHERRRQRRSYEQTGSFNCHRRPHPADEKRRVLHSPLQRSRRRPPCCPAQQPALRVRAMARAYSQLKPLFCN
jgi:hypothetical protein